MENIGLLNEFRAPLKGLGADMRQMLSCYDHNGVKGSIWYIVSSIYGGEYVVYGLHNTWLFLETSGSCKRGLGLLDRASRQVLSGLL